MPHFLDLDQLPQNALRNIINEAHQRKKNREKNHDRKPQGAPDDDAPCKNYVLAMVFEKASMRTRFSFDMAMRQLGGSAIIMDAATTHIAQGESMADTARVLSRYVDAIMLRAGDHQRLIEMAQYANVPVINGLTQKSHPAQIIADIMTFEEHRGDIQNCKIAWIGDGNNVALSWIHAAAQLGFTLHIATPNKADIADTAQTAQKLNPHIQITNNPQQAAENADALITDTWVSLSDPKDQSEAKSQSLTPYRITPELMALGKKNAVFMHCLPVWRGKEVDAQIADGPQSIIFDEAENRLHAQKAILLWALDKLAL